MNDLLFDNRSSCFAKIVLRPALSCIISCLQRFFHNRLSKVLDRIIDVPEEFTGPYATQEAAHPKSRIEQNGFTMRFSDKLLNCLVRQHRMREERHRGVDKVFVPVVAAD